MKSGPKPIKPVVKRGEIYFANLDPVVGHEQAGTRPVLIVQNDIANRFSSTVIVACITGAFVKAQIPKIHVEFSDKDSGLDYGGVVLLEQIRTLDKSRLIEKRGRLSKVRMQQDDLGLKYSVGLRQDMKKK
jgi:mRNA interferase MazF